MKREGKNISYTDFDLDIDMRMEIEKSTETSEKGGNTLDFYNDEMSRREVEKLISGRSSDKAPKPAESKPADEKPALKPAVDKAADATSEKVDYSYVVNLLNETQRDEGVRREKEVMTKMSTRKTQLQRAYKMTRLALIVVVVVFLGILTLLVANLQKTKKELDTVTAANTKLTTDYSALNIESGGYKAQASEQQKTISELNERIEELLSSTQPTQTSPPEQPTGNNPEQPTNPGTTTNNSNTTLPTKYVVKSGDSLWGISLLFYKDGNLYKEIMKANNMKSENDLKYGVEIIIPNV